MIIKTSDKNKINEIFLNLNRYINKITSNPIVKYLDLGTQRVRLLIYGAAFLPHIERQMTFVLRDKLDSYDCTLVLWQEEAVRELPAVLSEEFDLKTNFKLRIEYLVRKQPLRFFKLFDEGYSKISPIIFCNYEKETVEGCDLEKKTYYYGVKDLSAEEFIKEGHLFVQFINKIAKSNDTNIVHGAVVGIKDNGVLLCARGQRGKSTLTVLSMMEGFDYVSDDYLILKKERDNLYAYPIYSIITLSPKMYNELYDRLEGGRFVSNNARKDKYVINIKNFHKQFRVKYPIRLCIFPEITGQEKPSISICSEEEKGRAIVQLIQSTVSQMRDTNNTDTIKKLYSMVKDFNFYKFNLSPDIFANTEFLREFLTNFKQEEIGVIDEDKLYVDITFDIANILEPKSGRLYQMNHFATAVYQSLLLGESEEEILSRVRGINELSEGFEEDLKILIKEIRTRSLVRDLSSQAIKPNYDLALLRKNNFKLSFRSFDSDTNVELVKKENKND